MQVLIAFPFLLSKFCEDRGLILIKAVLIKMWNVRWGNVIKNMDLVAGWRGLGVNSSLTT